MGFKSKYTKNPFGSKRKSIVKQNVSEQKKSGQKKSRQKKSRQKKNIKDAKNKWFDDTILFACMSELSEKEIDKEANKFFKGKKPSNNPKAFFTYGYPGSGKTTMAMNYLGTKNNYVIESIDEVMENLNAFKLGTNIRLNDNTIIGSRNVFDRCQNQADKISGTILEMGINGRFNLFIDHPNPSVDTAVALKGRGYSITGLYVLRRWSTLKNAIENRALETGRFIDIFLDKKEFLLTLKLFSYSIAYIAKMLCDDFYICINDTGITIPKKTMEFLKKIQPPKIQSWTRSAIHYSVNLDKISIGELESLLSITKNM